MNYFLKILLNNIVLIIIKNLISGDFKVKIIWAQLDIKAIN